MKKLLLIRHGKAEPAGGDDISRRLTPVGAKQIQSIARKVMDAGDVPDKIYTSPAVRARETSEILMNIWEEERHFPSLQDAGIVYRTTADGLLTLILGAPETYNTVALVGHNPTMEHLVSYYKGSPVPIGTGYAASISFDINKWKDISSRQNSTVSIYKP